MLRNMLDGDGQDQYDAGGWCFPKPIPPVQRNGEWVVSIPSPDAATTQAGSLFLFHRAPLTCSADLLLGEHDCAGDGPYDAGEHQPGLRGEFA